MKGEYVNDGLKERIKSVLASSSLEIERCIDARGRTRIIDVRNFLISIELVDNDDIIVVCNISQAGSIRVEEMLRLLELDEGRLRAATRRTDIKWQQR